MTTSYLVQAQAQVAHVAQTTGTTFSDLIFGTVNDPWLMLAAAVGIALLGMISHWAKKNFKDGNGVSIVDWFCKNKRATYLAVGSMLGTLAATFLPLDYTTITMYQIFTQAFTIGYAADSFFNQAGEQ